MKEYKTLENGSFQIGNMAIPNKESNRQYKLMMKEVDAGDAVILPYSEPEPTEAELKAKAKLEGVEFEGVMCSATSEDMWGLASIKEWIRAGQTTNFEFKNGNVLTLSNDNIDAFEAVWIPFRASFFQ